MRNIRRTFRALIERTYFYSGKKTHKETIREHIKKSADQAYAHLTTESARKKKVSFVSKLMFTLIFFVFGVYLVINSMSHGTQSTYSPQAAVNTTSTQVTTTAPASPPSRAYTPGKGGNNVQTSAKKAKDAPACDPDKPLWDQIGNGKQDDCTYSGSGNGQTFTCDFSDQLLSQTDNSIGSTCTISDGTNNDQYYCYVNDWSQSLSSQTLQCNPYGSTQKCQVTSNSSTCQLQNSQGSTECSITPVANSITGIPPSTSNVPVPQATVCPIAVPTNCTVGTATTLPDWLTGANGILSSTSSTEIQSTIGNIWQTMCNIALALLVIPFFIAGYQIILSASSSRYAGSIQILTRVFIAGLAAAFSLTLIKMVVDVENVAAQAIVAGIAFNPPSGAQAIIVPANQWSCYAHQFFGSVFNMSVYSMQNANGSISTDQYVQLNYDNMSTIVNNLPFYIATLLSILLAIQLTVRFALICLQAALSPLVFVCGALPGDTGQMVIRPWIRGFASLLAVQLLQLLVILAGYTLFSALTNTALTGLDPSGWITTLFQTLIPIIIIIVALNIPRMMGSATTNIISMISSSFSSASTGVLLIIRGL